MKRIIGVLLITVAVVQQACYKDKGNYDYHALDIPEVKNFDTLYTVLIGDTLRISPMVTTANPNIKLGYEWRIMMPLEMRDTTIYGRELKMLFSLKPDKYATRLTVIDSTNNMKYFHETTIAGETPYSRGTMILSAVGATSQLTFVRTDGTLEPDVYRKWNGASLPGKPLQIINLFKENINPPPAMGYWATFDDTNDGGMHIANNTLVRIKSLRDNYFETPDSAKPGYLESTSDGVLRGVVNGKLMIGSSYTFYGAEIYGMFSLPPAGDYNLYKSAAFYPGPPYIIGYDVNRKQFVTFTNFGQVAYSGTNYQTTSTTAFDPKDVKLDLLHFQLINNTNCFAFGKAADGIVYELKFGSAFIGVVQFQPAYKRPFPQQSLITPSTKWAALNDEVFYFTSNDKIYRYNPTNQDIQPLVADFGGKAVTMIRKVDDNTLITAVDGIVYFLDISTGKFGNIIKTITGVPGTPVDVVIRK
jgi:hypothetical protein